MIHILTTGGTIEALDYVGDEGIKNSNVYLVDFLNAPNVKLDYSIESVFKKDSRTIDDDDRNALVSNIISSFVTNR